jgi:hypothetical protein
MADDGQRQAIEPVKSPYPTTEGLVRVDSALGLLPPPHLKVSTAWGSDADQRRKLLIYQAMEGPILDACLHALVSAMDYKTTS